MVYDAHQVNGSSVMTNTPDINHQNQSENVRSDSTKAITDTAMASPWKSINKETVSGQFEDCEDTPREVDLLTEEHIEDLLDAVDCLRGRVEQLQIHCEKLSHEKTHVEERLIEQERAGQRRMEQYEQEISELRKMNTQLAARQNTKEGEQVSKPSWVKTAMDAEQALEEKTRADNKVKSLEIKIMEKDKLISNLEWQLVDIESTVSSLQADRDRLAVELDCMLTREQEDLAAYGSMGDDKLVFSDEEDECNLSRSHKQAHHNLSNLSRHDTSNVEGAYTLVTQSARGKTVSDIDMASAGAFALGGLKRTTNYSNINDVDESADFHKAGSLRFVNSAVSDLSASFPVPKKPLVSSSWQSFGSDSDSEWRTSPKGKTLTAIRAHPDSAWGSDGHMDSARECSIGAGAFEDAVDIDLVPDKDMASDTGLSSNKNGSCRSSSSAYFSDSANEISQDLWTFTPDSIINVSTGEELHSPGPDSKTFPDHDKIPQEDDVISDQQENADELKTPTNQMECVSSFPDMTSATRFEMSPPDLRPPNLVTSPTSPPDVMPSNPVTSPPDVMPSNLVMSSGDVTSSSLVIPPPDVTSSNLVTSSACTSAVNLERTISVCSDSIVDTMSKEVAMVNHQRMNSAPMMQSPNRKYSQETSTKLDEYQKWKLGGRIGRPPAKLKISQC